jgi:DNA-binding SARP family transcriptional activator
MLRVRLLGGLRLELDGRSLEMPPGRRLRALLAWLALNPGPQPRARIAARFWPDVLDESARGSLRTALLELRRALGAEAARYLQATPDTIGVGPAEGLWVDVCAFELAVEKGDLDQALALASDELLPELDDDWVHEARDAHRQAVGSVLAGLAERAEASADLTAAVDYARRIVALDPLDEQASQRLIRLLTAAGDRPAALAAFARLRDRLRDELRIAPSASTRQVVEQVRAGDPADARAGPASADTATVALLFTDLAGSTEILGQLGDEAAERLRRSHFGMLRDLAKAHGGHEVKSLGDGLMIVFTSTVDAVGCAVAIQQAARHPAAQGDGPQLLVRIGLNVGEPIRHEDDYFGTPVVVAKRLCDDAEPGTILASRLVEAIVGTRGRHRFRDVGALALKGIAEPVPACEVLWQQEIEQALPLPPALERELEGSLFGRAPELEQLRQRFDRVCHKGLACVLLAGEPGVGKTRLMAELCRIAHGEGATVLYGRCAEDALRPYEAFVEALRGYVIACPADRLRIETGPGRPWLARLVPEVTELLPETRDAPAGDAEAERWRLFDAVAGLLESAARAVPVVLALDDLHWSDRTTLQLLDHLVRTTPHARVLVLGTYRDTEVEGSHPLAEALARLRRARTLDLIRLEGLSESAVGELMSATSTVAAERDLVRPVFEETEGNPFFVQEIMRELDATTGDETDRRPSDVLASLGVPDSVKDLVGRRLARLSEAANRVIGIAAVLGREFEVETLERLAGLPEDELLDVLEEAVDARVVAEIPRVPGRLTFAHALVRETVYEGLSATRRARLHLRAGAVIEDLFADSLREHYAALAHHHAVGGDATKALRYHLLAGQAAEAVFAGEEAVRSYSRALDAAAELGLEADDPAVYDLRCRRGREVFATGDYRGALTDLEAAVAGARAAGDARAEMEALLESGLVRRTGDVESAIACHERALTLAETIGDPRGQVAQLARLSFCHSQRLGLEEALRLGERALELARGAQDDEAVATALDAVKRVALQIGDLALLDAATGELLELRSRAGGQWPLERWFDWVLLERAFIPIAQARWEDAFAGLQEALEANRRLMDRMGEPLFLDALCWCHRSRGEFERAVAFGEQAVARAEAVGSPEWIAWTCATLGWALLDASDPTASLKPLERGLDVVEGPVARGQLLRCAALLALARSRTGDQDGATALAERAAALIADVTAPPGSASLLWAHADLAVARVWLDAGEVERAGRLVTPLLPAAQDAGWHETTAVASVLAGRCRVASGDRAAGVDLIGRGVELARASDLGPARAEAEDALAALASAEPR